MNMLDKLYAFLENGKSTGHPAPFWLYSANFELSLTNILLILIKLLVTLFI